MTAVGRKRPSLAQELGGDHLHYGVYLHGVAVLPVEWWDSKWIKDNIRRDAAAPQGRAEEAPAVGAE